MTTTTGAKPHPIFLAGKWVESDDPLVIANPADDHKARVFETGLHDKTDRYVLKFRKPK